MIDLSSQKAMSFQTKTVMEQRLELVRLASQPGANISNLCKRFCVSRMVCYKWMKRFAEGGISYLKDKSRKPNNSPNKTSNGVEKKIIDLRKKNPEWGGRKLHAILVKSGLTDTPAPRTITSILHRHNLIPKEKTDRLVPPKRFEYSSPNELWQMDFKGQFKMLNNGFCHPLTILDDHSRFNICLQACNNQTSQTVKDQLISIFRRYGLPDKILADNGAPWGTAGHVNSDGQIAISTLAIWLMRLNVLVIHGRPYHPQTQGKEERFHRTLKTELLQYQQFNNINHSQKGFDKWRNKYNLERPHQALNYKTPSELYIQSKRSFPETLPAIDYNDNDEVRKVNNNGSINYKGKSLKIGKGLKGQYVAIRPTGTEKKEIYYCNQRIKDMIC
jgi:transposase InsO family protein/transposase-like protein